MVYSLHPRFICPLLSFSLLLPSGCSQHEETSSRFETTHAALSISVPSDAATIQAAIDSASAGDSVVIAAGAFAEDLTINKALTLIGSGDETVIYGSITVADNATVNLENLVVDGTLSSGAVSCVSLDSGTLTMTLVTTRGGDIGLDVLTSGAEGEGQALLNGCTFTAAATAGVRLSAGSAADLQVFNSTFAYNGGDGLLLEAGAGNASTTVAHTLFFANGYGVLDGAAIWSADGDFISRNNIITSNNHGVACLNACSGAHNLVWGNLINFAAEASAGPGHVHKDPRFVAASEGDFSLMADSPAIDAGDTSLTSLASLSLDANGLPRPLGAGPDIGPFEYPDTPPGLTLVITEVLANGVNGGNNEFIELLNVGATTIDAAGLIIDDGDARDTLTAYEEGGVTLIAPGGYAVIIDPSYEGIYSIPADAVILTVADSQTLGSGLSTSDPVKLLDASGALPISSFSHPSDPGKGISLELDALEDGDVAGNWVPSPCGNSPGQSNCASLPPNISAEVFIAINEVMANPLSETTGEFIELYNFGTDPVELEGMVLSDGDTTDVITGWQGGATSIAAGQFAVIIDPDYDGAYNIATGALWLTVATSSTLGNGLAVNDPISLLDPSGYVLIDTYTHTLNGGNGISSEKVEATIGDIAPNFTASTCLDGHSAGRINCATLDGTNPISGATLAIMEVMANPIDEDQDEFIELLNYGLESIDLTGFRISDGDREEPLVGFGGGATVLEPGARALIVDAEYGGTYAIPSTTVLMTTPDTSIGSGLSTNDPIGLRAPKGAAAIDTFYFPFNPGNGISAEKIDLLIGDVPQNWTASACNASPGLANCSAMSGSSETQFSSTGIIISEVMANAKVESRGEFIELFNGGPAGVDVQGWVITDGDAVDTIQSFNGGSTLISPGQFAVILDPDYTTNTYYFPAGTVKLTVGDSTLGNGLTTTDPVTLFEANGTTVASTFSFPFNPGNGRSVEKLTLTAPDAQPSWVSSSCRKALGHLNNFASPGAKNCVDGNDQFNGTQALGQPCPFGASDCLSGLCAVDILTGASFCTEDCDAGCPEGTSCELILDLNYDSVCVPVGGGATPEVVINEVLYDAPGVDKDVFVELYGAPNTILDGVVLVGVNGSNGALYREIYLTGMIGADGYFVIAHPEAAPWIADNADMLTVSVDYQNGPDSLQLQYAGQTLDALAYGTFSAAETSAGEGAAAIDVETGQSLVRVDEGVDTDDNAADFEASTYPSPGAAHIAQPAPVCGDGVVDRGEACDDGNTLAGDGCGSTCQLAEVTSCETGCTSDAQCADELTCVGSPSGQASGFAQCVDTSSVAGSYDACGPEVACGPGLACLGEYAWGGGGWCVESWFAKSFVSDMVVSIPDNDSAGISSSVVACGLATVPVDVVVTVDITHPSPESLTLQVQDPAGNIFELLNGAAVIPSTMTAYFSGDEMVNGSWTLTVKDSQPGETGTLHGWSIYLLSNWD